MAGRRVNPHLIKLHRTYSVPELAACLAVHKNTVRHWQRDGLKPIDARRPVLFQGATIRTFLFNRNASRKRPCPPGTFYCFRCREPRPPALGMIEYLALTAVSGNLRAICATCETMMHRRARYASLSAIMPGLEVQTGQALPRLKGSPSPSLNCDVERQATA
ncbi:MAG: hypothetical protein ACR2FJ_02890 [Qipengyuania sp.]